MYDEKILELTTDETLGYFEGHLHTQSLRRLKRILCFADLIKFAKHKPVDEENRDIFERVVSMIKDINLKFVSEIKSNEKELA